MRSDHGSFGDLLRARRLARQMSQQELADRAGVSVRAVRYIEQGRIHDPRPESVRRLAHAVGLTTEDIAPQLPGEDRIRIGVLGPLTVHQSGHPVDVGSVKQRCLLAVLALQPGQVVGRDEIIDMLWPRNPPRTCTDLVHAYVSRLRKLLRDRTGIKTVRAGYRLVLRPEQLDLSRFGDLVAGARQAPDESTLDVLGLALDCWRGPVLADMPDRLRQHPAAVAAAGRRLAVTLEYADAALAAGQHARAIPHLQVLSNEEPLHEGLHARLMLAFAGTGRQAAALDLFNQLRDRLADDLGVTPGTELREAHLRVLRQEFATARGSLGTTHPAASPAQLPAAVSGFTGRAHYLQQLDELLPNAAATNAVVVAMISGTAGVGKTALAVHWSHQVRGHFPDGQLYLDLRGHAPVAPIPPLEALGRFLRALGVPAERVPTELDEAAGLYRTLLADRKILVVLDDAAGVDQVRPLLPGSPACLVVVTSRDRLDGLVARDGARRLTLDVLSPAEAGALLTWMVGADTEQDLVAELAEACAYLPLALRISAAHLTSNPHRSLAGYVAELRGASRLSTFVLGEDDEAAVRAAFDLSYQALDEPARRLFRLMGLIPGPDVTLDAAARLADVPVHRAGRLLDRLAEAHMIHQHAPGRYTFHDLLRIYAAERARAEDPAAERNAARKRLYDWYLRTVSSLARVLYPETFRLPLPEDDGPAPGTLVEPASALEWLDAERTNLVMAVKHAAQHGPRPATWQFTAALRGYFLLRMHTIDWQSVADTGLATAEAEGHLLGQITSHHSLAELHIRRSHYSKTIEHADRALRLSRRADWVPGQVVALEHLSFAHWRSGRLPEADTHAAQAIELNRRAGWEGGEITSMCLQGLVMLERGQLERATSHYVRTLGICRAVGARYGEGFSLAWLGQAYRELGRLADAAEHLDQARAVHRQFGTSTIEPHTLRNLAALHKHRGDYPRALELVDKALTIARTIDDPHAEADALNTLASIHRRLGRHRDASDGHRQALLLARRTGYRYCETSAVLGSALTHHHLGRPELALAHARRVLDAATEAGYQLLVGHSHTVLAIILLAGGRPAQALAHAQQAVAAQQETAHGLPQAHSHYVLGLALRETKGVAEALPVWQHALALAIESGSAEIEVLQALVDDRPV